MPKQLDLRQDPRNARLHPPRNLEPEGYAPRRILVPFAGTMSESIGAMLVGWEEIVAIESEEEYVKIGKARLEYWTKQPKQLKLIEG